MKSSTTVHDVKKIVVGPTRLQIVSRNGSTFFTREFRLIDDKGNEVEFTAFATRADDLDIETAAVAD